MLCAASRQQVWFLYHFFFLSAGSGLDSFTRSVFNLGDAGVNVFFFISGFIIPASLLRHKTLREFWASRFLRLFPLYWFSLAVALALGFMGRIQLDPQFRIAPVRSVVLNLCMIQIFTHAPLALGTYWTLCLELLFYALCSLLFLFGVLRRSLIIAYGFLGSLLLTTTLIGAGLFRGNVAQIFQVRWIGLIAAALVGTVLFRYSRGEVSRRHIWALLGLFLGVLTAANWVRFDLYLNPFDNAYTHFVPQETSWLVATLIFILLFARRSRPTPAILNWLGKISYSLYLMHPIASALTPWTAHSPFLRAAEYTVLAVLLATGTYYWIERDHFHLGLWPRS